MRQMAYVSSSDGGQAGSPSGGDTHKDPERRRLPTSGVNQPWAIAWPRSVVKVARLTSHPRVRKQSARSFHALPFVLPHREPIDSSGSLWFSWKPLRQVSRPAHPAGSSGSNLGTVRLEGRSDPFLIHHQHLPVAHDSGGSEAPTATRNTTGLLSRIRLATLPPGRSLIQPVMMSCRRPFTGVLCRIHTPGLSSDYRRTARKSAMPLAPFKPLAIRLA